MHHDIALVRKVHSRAEKFKKTLSKKRFFPQNVLSLISLNYTDTRNCRIVANIYMIKSS